MKKDRLKFKKIFIIAVVFILILGYQVLGKSQESSDGVIGPKTAKAYIYKTIVNHPEFPYWVEKLGFIVTLRAMLSIEMLRLENRLAEITHRIPMFKVIRYNLKEVLESIATPQAIRGNFYKPDSNYLTRFNTPLREENALFIEKLAQNLYVEASWIEDFLETLRFFIPVTVEMGQIILGKEAISPWADFLLIVATEVFNTPLWPSFLFEPIIKKTFEIGEEKAVQGEKELDNFKLSLFDYFQMIESQQYPYLAISSQLKLEPEMLELHPLYLTSLLASRSRRAIIRAIKIQKIPIDESDFDISRLRVMGFSESEDLILLFANKENGFYIQITNALQKLQDYLANAKHKPSTILPPQEDFAVIVLPEENNFVVEEDARLVVFSGRRGNLFRMGPKRKGEIITQAEMAMERLLTLSEKRSASVNLSEALGICDALAQGITLELFQQIKNQMPLAESRDQIDPLIELAIQRSVKNPLIRDKILINEGLRRALWTGSVSLIEAQCKFAPYALSRKLTVDLLRQLVLRK